MSTYLALLTRYFHDKSLALRLTVFPLSAPFVAIPFAYVAGCLLKRYYNAYSYYIEDIKNTKDQGELLRLRETWEKSTFQTLYVFYVFCALVAMGCNALNIYKMKD
jgi:hypothetical protein